MRRLPIDTSSIEFTIASEPRPVLDFDTKQPKVVDGAALSSLNLLVRTSDEISIISVKVAGLSGHFMTGDIVRVRDLTALPWVNNGKDGIAFSAEGIEQASKSKAA